MDWGNQDPQMRGPVVVSRAASTIRRRNGWYSLSLLILCPLLISFLAIGGQLLFILEGMLDTQKNCSARWLVLGLLCFGGCKQRDQDRP